MSALGLTAEQVSQTPTQEPQDVQDEEVPVDDA